MELPRAIHDAMLEHAREALPNEACGLVLASGAVERLTNIAGSPYCYEVDRNELMGVEGTSRVWGIYHSHIASPGYPSEADVRGACFPPGGEPIYPGAIYLIVSLLPDILMLEGPWVRGFWIRRGGKVEEEPIELVG